MPTHVPRNEEGFEDPDEFFKSSPSVHTRSSLRTPRNANHLPSSSPPMPPPSTGPRPRRHRMSDLAEPEDDEEDRLTADGLLDEGFGDENVTPPRLIHESSPSA